MEQNTNTNTTANKPMNPLIIVGIIAAVVLIGFALMRSSTGNSTTQNTDMEQSNTAMTAETSPAMEDSTSPTDSMKADEGEVKEFKMEAGSFYYTPNEIRVKKGDKVKVVMTSKDMMHDFTLDEFNVKSAMAKAGETVTVEFTADKTGTFEFYCSVGQHRANGQVGTLIVE